MSRINLLRERLEAKLSPLQLRVVDESLQHAGHAGAPAAGGESHFSLEIVAAQFTGLSRVARHRLIYEALGGAFDEGLHALRIAAKAPGE